MKQEYSDLFRGKLDRYARLRKEVGEEPAWEKMLEGYPERQRRKMGRYIDNTTLAEGFSQAIPHYKKLGMTMQVVDISNRGIDAVLEIQYECPYLEMSKEYGIDNPCHVLCDMDIEATRRAFPDMNVRYVARQSEGDCICAYKYERPAR